MRPYALRPPVFGFGFVRRFSGLSLVISEKSDDVWNRRPALVGLRLRMGIPSAPEDVDTVLAGGEGDDRPLLARRRVVCPGLPVARALALAVDRVDLLHTLTEVAERLPHRLFGTEQHQEHTGCAFSLRAEPERLEELQAVLRARGVDAPLVDHHQLAVRGTVGERRSQRELHHLLRRVL